MKKSFLLLCSLLTIPLSASAFAAPGSTAPASAMPPSPQPAMTMPSEVAAVMLPSAKSLFLKRFPMGGTPVLLHLWTLVRSGEPDPKGSSPASPPLFVDLFAPSTAPDSWLIQHTLELFHKS